jgi:hypothetical protein
MRHLDREQARAFAAKWLPAWTGNRPEHLLSFYSEDAFYLDPGVPDGLQGRNELLAYFRKLLAAYPDWVWTQTDAIPMEDGFLNKWHAMIPVGGRTIEATGVCLVQFDDEGLIRRNEVYFDRSLLLQAIASER